MPEQKVHITRIEPHPDNARHDTGDVTELAASIRAQGLLQPLVVCVHPWRPGAYLLLAGHRRLAAAKQLRLDYVPVIVRQAPEEAQVLMLVENCQRVELSAVEKAEAMGRLRDTGWVPARIARETGLSVSSVNRYLALLELDQASRDRVRAGTVAVGDAIAAVASTRQSARRASGHWPPGPRRPATVPAEHFSETHPLGGRAQVRCELAGHEARKYGKRRGSTAGLACGECWEAVIREDERSGGKLAAQGRKPEAVTAAQRERLDALSTMRLHDSSDPVPAPGVVTAAEAAERLGVTPRTVERYKSQLRSQVAAS